MRLLLSLACLLVVGTTVTRAQTEFGDPSAGFIVADELCTECHAVRPEETMSPIPEIPGFKEIANTSGLTAMALFAWLTTSHPLKSMPDLLLEDEDLRNVVAYIRSLDDRE